MKKKAEIIWAVIFIAFGSFFYYLTLDLRPSPGPDVGGAFYPRLLIYATLILSIKLLYNAFKKDSKDSEKLFDFENGGFWNVILVIIISFIYLYFLEIIGFLLLTPIYLFSLLTIIEAKKFYHRILISILTTLIVMYIFQNFLNVPFPGGILS
ncbi:MAG: tripartite tricarboxylate transporter TctB family protein [Halanaerobium sp.]